jgi:hypothetical protein
MAATKAVTAIFSGETFVAGEAHAASSVITLDDGYGAALHVKITNGATGPTIPLSLQIQVSSDNSEFYDFGGPLQGLTTNNGVISWGGIEIPIGVEYLRLISAVTNTGQNVTVDADISEVTAV